MNRQRGRLIEQQARDIQLAIWRDRDLLWPTFKPPLVDMFQPDKAAEVLGIGYELHPELRLLSRTEIAGIVDRQANKIAVAQRFGFETTRFTGAHEIGHWLLHDREVMHRDPPVRAFLPIGARDRLSKRRRTTSPPVF